MEPEIIINGLKMDYGCSITIMIAIEVFASSLMNNPDLRNELALERIQEIRKAMGIETD